MKKVVNSPVQMTKTEARHRWIEAQRLHTTIPFGSGPAATQAAVEHLGYVQIDTINVIERSHHHILFNRIPRYQPSDLHFAQTHAKSVFEYWTHALSYIPTRDYRFFMRDMQELKKNPTAWYESMTPADFRKVLQTIKKEGALSIRDIEDDTLVEKTHPWASRKPSKKALQFGFYTGELVISERIGMLKKYELRDRHFGWNQKPKAAQPQEILQYLLERALRSQAIVSLDSICYLELKNKPAILKLIQTLQKKGELVQVEVLGLEKILHWMRASELTVSPATPALTHLLSPFDPLVIQRKRLEQFFGYEHRFEAYLPKEKRKMGYFALPVLHGDAIVAALDLKTDRAKKKLLIQQWTWLPKQKSSERKKHLEEELHRFEKFQLGQF